MMKRLLSKLFVAAALVTPLLLAGCADPPAAAKTAPPAAREAATPAPRATPTAAEKALRELATDADPRVQVAVLNAQGLRASEEKFHSLYARLKPKLDPGRLGKNWEKELSPADFKEACRALREMAEDLEAAHVEFVIVSDRYEEQLARGPQAYRVAAAYFQERSVKSSERLFRDGYAELAGFSERFAALIEERQKVFARFRAEVTETRDYLKKSARYVRDVEGVATFTPASEGGDFRASHRSFLLVYVRAFNEFLDLTAGFTDSLKARPLPASPAEAPPTPGGGYVPGKGAPPSTFAFSYQTYAGQPDAAIDESARKGEASVRLVRDARAEHGPLTARLAANKGKPLPPALKAELEAFERRAKAIRAVELLEMKGAGPFVADAGSPAVSVGEYLPVIRDDQAKRGGPFFVGVVKVEAVVGNRATLRAVRGTLQDDDCAVTWPAR